MISQPRFSLGWPAHEDRFRSKKWAEKAESLIQSFFPPSVDAVSHCPKPTGEEKDLASRLYREFGGRFRLRYDTYLLVARRILEADRREWESSYPNLTLDQIRARVCGNRTPALP